MVQIHEVAQPTEPFTRFRGLISPERMQQLEEAARVSALAFEGRSVWNVNSTAAGGGVAEMLAVLVPYARGAGVDARWLVLEGEAPFFALTKRLHNRFHGSDGDGGPLGDDEQAVYRRVSEANAVGLADLVRPGDIVVLHDPQTAGLTDAVKAAGAHAVWRCHIGPETHSDHWRAAADFLRPHLAACDRFVFTRDAHVFDWVDRDRVIVVPPSIDPFAPKNADLDDEVVRGILSRTGLVDHGTPDAPTTYHRRDGSSARVDRSADLVRGDPVAPGVPMVVQVSRWDRLKDMRGVLTGFVDGVTAPAHLLLVGPSVEGVADDPEGADVLEECVAAWDALEDGDRSRVTLACLPMEDVEENAAMVNAAQRHAAVVVQKSLQEGFGLTVTEAMWKARPVLASAVGGIRDQIEDDVHGVLLADAADLEAFGAALDALLRDGERRRRLGVKARERVIAQFLGDRHLLQYAALIADLDRGPAASA